MSKGEFRLGESIRFGWSNLWAHLGVLLACFGIYVAVVAGVALLRVVFQIPPLAVGLLNGFVIGPLLALGFNSIGLKIVDGGDARIGDLFGQGSLILKYWLVLLALLAVMALAALPALVVAGTGVFLLTEVPRALVWLLAALLLLAAWAYLALRLMFVMWLLVDKAPSVGACLRGSFDATRDHVAGLFVLGLALLGINLLGLLCLGVGVVFSSLMSLLIFAHAYRGLEGGPAAA